MALTAEENEKFIKHCDALYQRTTLLAEKMKAKSLEYAECKLVAVWGDIPRELEPSGDVNVPLGEWCRLAGLPPSEINLARCEKLIQLHIVLPDGRVHHWVERHLLGVE